MRNTLVLTIVLALSVWAIAQQPSSTPPTDPSASGAQTTPQTPSTGTAPSSGAQMPDPGAQAPSTAPGSTAPGAGGQTPVGTDTVTEGCLGGSAPNFTITDNAGKVYTLSLPQGADPSVLTSHVGESVQVMGPVSSSTIQVSKVGKGTGTCAKSKTSETPPSK